MVGNQEFKRTVWDKKDSYAPLASDALRFEIPQTTEDDVDAWLSWAKFTGDRSLRSAAVKLCCRPGMQVKARQSRALLARRLANESKAYSYIKDAAEHGRMNIRYLAGGRLDFPVEVETESAYALLDDVILSGVAKIIEDAEWPEPGLPIPERERRLAELDAEIAKLTAERDVLANQLIEAGLAS